MSQKVEGFLMNAEGSSFDKTPDGGLATVPFRPYFVEASLSRQANSRSAVRSILFDSKDSSFAFGDDDPSEGEMGKGTLEMTSGHHKITVTSSLTDVVDVRIMNAGGVTIAAFTIQPGETIEKPIRMTGIYIVRAAGGRYQKKLAVR